MLNKLYSLPQDYRRRLMLLAVLVVSSAMSVSMVLLRLYITGFPTYLGFIWNLFLAWIPLGCALAVWLLDRKTAFYRPLVVLLFLGWLAFFPNAPYMVTDLIHLRPRLGISVWFDLMLVFSFAWNALLVGFVSLRILQKFVEQRYSKMTSWAFVFFALWASSFGVFLGRFLRRNSWDFVTNPKALFYDIAVRLADPFAHPNTFGFILIVGVFLVLAYATVNLLIETNWQQDQPS